MALYLEHNSDTSLNMMSKILHDKLKEITTYRNVKEFDNLSNEGTVQIVDISLKENLEELIQSIDNNNSATEFLPKILIAQSKEIDHTKYLSNLSFAKKEAITLVNKDDETDIKLLEGTWFEYETRVQLLLLTRSTFVNKDLSLELIRILYEMRSIKYPLRLYDDTVPNLFYEVENYGTLDLMGFENSPMMMETIGESKAIVATGIEFSLRENYFRLKEASVYRNLEINPKVSQE